MFRKLFTSSEKRNEKKLQKQMDKLKKMADMEESYDSISPPPRQQQQRQSQSRARSSPLPASNNYRNVPSSNNMYNTGYNTAPNTGRSGYVPSPESKARMYSALRGEPYYQAGSYQPYSPTPFRPTAYNFGARPMSAGNYLRQNYGMTYADPKVQELQAKLQQYAQRERDAVERMRNVISKVDEIAEQRIAVARNAALEAAQVAESNARAFAEEQVGDRLEAEAQESIWRKRAFAAVREAKQWELRFEQANKRADAMAEELAAAFRMLNVGNGFVPLHLIRSKSDWHQSPVFNQNSTTSSFASDDSSETSSD